jgi:hypothetical protein
MRSVRACGDKRGSAGYRWETSRHAKAGPWIRRAARGALVHAAERKQVFRYDGHDDRCADGAENLATGEEEVRGQFRPKTCGAVCCTQRAKQQARRPCFAAGGDQLLEPIDRPQRQMLDEPLT